MRRRVSAAAAALLIVGLLAPAGASARTVQSRPLAQRAKSPDTTFVAHDALSRALEQGRLSRAEYALERAKSVFRLGRVRARYGDVGQVDPREVTIVLRDLALVRHELTGAQKTAADRIFARPDDPAGEPFGTPYSGTSESECNGDFCVHWSTQAGDPNNPPVADIDANGIPDFADSAITTMEEVWAQEIDTLGYQRPKSDATSDFPGPDGSIDVYLANVGSDGVYGYCTTDDPNLNVPNPAFWDASSYCVVDNDMSEFTNKTPLENLQVTVAHEFFHAVQFGYDIGDDSWFMEAGAAWIEDVVYDNVNDNYQYLLMSALTFPYAPLDLMDSGDFFGLRYGQFLYIRFLTELLGDGVTPDVDIVREMWERAAFREGHPEDPDDYSVLAIANVLAAHGYDFADVFADFHMFNWVLDLFYEEGLDYINFMLDQGASVRPPVAEGGAFKITKKKPKTGKWNFESLHLTSANLTFKPGKGVKSNAKLLLKVDGPGSAASPEARYIVFYKTGLPKLFDLQLDGSGVGKKKIPFGKGKVQLVVLVLVNASTRYGSCYSGSTPYSCSGGVPKDDGAKFAFSGTLKQ